MFGFKRTTRSAVTAAPALSVDTREVAYASAWGLTYSAWLALSAEQRRDYRDRVVYAPNFQSVGN